MAKTQSLWSESQAGQPVTQLVSVFHSLRSALLTVKTLSQRGTPASNAVLKMDPVTQSNRRGVFWTNWYTTLIIHPFIHSLLSVRKPSKLSLWCGSWSNWPRAEAPGRSFWFAVRRVNHKHNHDFQPTINLADRHSLDHSASNLKDTNLPNSPSASQNSPRPIGYTVNRPVNQIINLLWSSVPDMWDLCTFMCVCTIWPWWTNQQKGYPRLWI